MSGINGNGRLGLKQSEKTKKKISDSQKAREYKLSDETKDKIRSIKLKDNWMRGRCGELHPKWKGGYVPNYPLDWTDTLRESIRQRDDYVCQLCGIHQEELNYRLDVHHIDYDKNNCNPINLISLCRNCHLKTNLDREYWIKHLKEVQ